MGCKLAMVAVILVLGGCREDAQLSVAQTPHGLISLKIAAPASNFRACIDDARIYPKAKPDHSMWEIGRTNPALCVQHVTVGVASAGLAQRFAAPPYTDGAYCAEVNGPGFSVRRGFVIWQGRVDPKSTSGAAC